MAYDWLLLGGLLFVVTLIQIFFRGGVAIDPGTWWYTLSLVLTGFLFYGWFWTHGGQTLGLRAWKLRVVGIDGGELSWRDAAMRYLAAVTLLLPPGIGLLWAGISSRGVAWHDLLSRTRVVRVAEN